MQVFISWSGAQSEAVARVIHTWLPEVLAEKVVPFLSSEDIDKGTRGLPRIATELEESGFGIVVITPSNKDSTWLNFEAGALGKKLTDGKVAPVLVGLSDADLDGPLKQFQNSSATDKAALLKLAQSVNKSLTDPLPVTTVERLFESQWPELEAGIKAALSMVPVLEEKSRASEDLLDEVLTTVRALQRQVDSLTDAITRTRRSVRTSPHSKPREDSDRFVKGLSTIVDGVEQYTFHRDTDDISAVTVKRTSVEPLTASDHDEIATFALTERVRINLLDNASGVVSMYSEWGKTDRSKDFITRHATHGPVRDAEAPS